MDDRGRGLSSCYLATEEPTGDAEQGFSACDRLFCIHEMVRAFLNEADTLSLVNCQRVCRLWKFIIDQSSILQERLFLKPVSWSADDEGSVVLKLNPVLCTHFQPLLDAREQIQLSENEYGLRTDKCVYDDLLKLPWARDGTGRNAPTRSAFARREASWRKMLICQPPVNQKFHWWHEWESSDRGRDGEQDPQRPLFYGGGHRSFQPHVNTIGKLWDLLESMLLRGCSSQVTFFVTGGSVEDDPTASEAEKRWYRYSGWHLTDGPRIRLRSFQVWPGEGPRLYQKFDLLTRAWEIQDEYPPWFLHELAEALGPSAEGDGLTWLEVDFVFDTGDENWRWSRSDAFNVPRLVLEPNFGIPTRKRRVRENRAHS